MVRRGSTVRVRQRALQKPRITGLLFRQDLHDLQPQPAAPRVAADELMPERSRYQNVLGGTVRSKADRLVLVREGALPGRHTDGAAETRAYRNAVVSGPGVVRARVHDRQGASDHRRPEPRAPHALERRRIPRSITLSSRTPAAGGSRAARAAPGKTRSSPAPPARRKSSRRETAPVTPRSPANPSPP